MYNPRNPPSDPAGLPQYLRDEFAAISFALANQVPYVYLQVLNASPDKPRNGMIIEADGVNFNPGSGAGTYMRRSGAWVKLG
jgi:hypothetical protein